MATIELPEHERERRSELAKKMNSEVVVDTETGLERPKFGGPQPRSGRPRKRDRAAEKIAEQAEKKAEEIRDVLFDTITDANPPHVRQAGVSKILEIEERERLIKDDQDREFRKLQRDELKERLVDQLEKLVDSGAIDLNSVMEKAEKRKAIEGIAARIDAD